MSGSSGSPDISTRIGGLELRSPVLLASGTCGYGPDLARAIRIERLGGIVTKTITVSPRAGNPPPRVAETPSGLLNSIGLENVGLKGFLAEVAPRLDELPTAVVVSAGGESIEEYLKIVRALASVECARAVELNISCPNVEKGMAFGSSPSLARELVAACRGEWPRVLITKLTPNVTDVAGVAAACEEAGSDALTVANTYLGMKVDIASRRPALRRGCGGLSGPAIRPLAVAKVWEVSRAVKIPVLGSGGVCTAEDALEHIIAGASAVQVGTATFVTPGAAESIVSGIESYCRDGGVPSLKALVGSLRMGDRTGECGEEG